MEEPAVSTTASNATTLDNGSAPSVAEKAEEISDNPHEISNTSPSANDEKQIEKTTEVEDPSTAKTDDEEDDYDYPKSTTLAFITIALMLSVSHMRFSWTTSHSITLNSPGILHGIRYLPHITHTQIITERN